MVVDLGETRFQSIGSLTTSTALDPAIGPTVEAAKVFNGRVSAVYVRETFLSYLWIVPADQFSLIDQISLI